MRNWFKKGGLTSYERSIVDNVDKHGCFITAVFDPDGDPLSSFAYSIGFAKTAEKAGVKPLPEVILFGLPNNVYAPAINELLQIGIGGFPMVDGAKVEKFLGEFDCVFRAVHESWLTEEYLNSAMWYHRTQMNRKLEDVMMVVWPDASHRFPWDNGCDEWVRSAQPALYQPRILN